AFSLLKTIVFKTKDRKKTVAIICSVLSVAVFTVALITALRNSEYDTALLFLLALFLQYPFAVYYIGKRFAKKKSVSEKKTSHTGNVRTNPKLFFLAGLFLSVLCGLTIPSNIIKASPLEFTFSNYSFNPLWYLVSSGCIAFGTFVIWLGVFYWLSSEKKKIAFELFYVGISGFATLSYFLLGKNLGTLTSSLSYLSQSTLNYPNVEKIISVAILLALITLLALFYVKFIEKRKFFMPLIASGCLALCILSATNVQGIHSELSTYNAKTISSTNVKIPLSKTERNIAIIMLDRAMGAYVPYIFNEKPTLKEQFSGFTYYSNVISFGRSTNFGAPPLFGGYEYTPVEMNSRKGESLKDKNNEAISVLPRIFGENGYHITYINPVYANYYYKSELSVFEPYPYITASVIDELSSDTTLTENNIHNNFRNFYLYSVMRTLPIFLQPLVYDGGNYYINNNTQRLESPYRAIGNRDTFLKAYSILQNLSSITETNNSNGEVLIMTNNTTHDIQLLQEPAYEPRDRVDNEKYDLMHTNRFTVNNRTLKMKNHKHYTHYQCNVAALMRLGEWFDFLRANDVYDNTKIIIVSDHGYGTDMEQLKELIIEEGNSALSDAEAYFPLLMIKDYNSKGFSVSNEFMTNADVPTIALEGAVENPVNPFTQKPINSKEKFAHKQYIIASYDFDIAKNNGNQFNPSMWYSVQDSIWEHKNWERVADKAVLTNDDINE
ncbi:MAG: hypothetical protein IKS12_00035, partial [Eubacterium sp.]|nr:hypothetical protein [Eubacterium sp.]